MLEIDVLPASTNTKGADSILVRIDDFSDAGFSNNQKIILIDGGFSDNTDRIINHVKTIYGSPKIDCVICTHPDADHINGLISLIDSDALTIDNLCVHNPWQHAYTVSRKIVDGRSTTNSVRSRLDESLSALDDLLTLAKKKSIKLYQPFAGFEIYDKITVLGPSKEYYCDLVKQYPGMHENRSLTGDGELVEVPYDPNNGHFYENPITSARNDSSLVLYLNDDGFSAIFTGDCGIEGLRNSLAYAAANNIDVSQPDYLQLPHHGSIKNINADIIDKINPKKAFVSAPNESIKHPSRLIMNYLRQHKAVNVYHVSTGTIRIGHKAPKRIGWETVNPLSIFQTVYVPRR